MNEKKYRHELKFILSPKIAEILKYRLSFVMDLDENSVSDDNTYLIRSLYFDDLKASAYYDKLDGIENRVKYRIRFYNLDETFIRLEIKEKNRDLTHKKQTRITKEECLDLIRGKVNLRKTSANEVMDEFTKVMKLKHLRPAVIVDYRRLAYTHSVEDVRVTFDSKVTSGKFNCDLFSKDIFMYDTMESNETILEVKFNNYIPRHIASIINSVPTVKQAISKYAMCYEMKEV